MATFRIDGFKFDPANWAGIDPMERKACARFAAARERELNTITTVARELVGGPFYGVMLEIDATATSTAPITVSDWSGASYHAEDGKNVWTWHGTKGTARVNAYIAAHRIPADTAPTPADPVTVDCADSKVDAYMQALEAQDVGDLSEAIAAIEHAAPAELASVCAMAGSAEPVRSENTTHGKIEAHSPQSDHEAARASAAPGVGGGGGRPFENEISATPSTPDRAAMESAGWIGETGKNDTIWTKIANGERYTAIFHDYCAAMEVSVLVDCVDTQIAFFKAENGLKFAELANTAVSEDQAQFCTAQTAPDATMESAENARQSEATKHMIFTKSGKPFSNYFAAQSARKKMGFEDTHNIVRWVINGISGEVLIENGAWERLIGCKTQCTAMQTNPETPAETPQAAPIEAAATRDGWEYAIGETYIGGIEAAVFTANQRGDGFQYRVGNDAIMERKPTTHTPPQNGTGFAQQARSHFGAWCAAMYRTAQGAHVLRFDVPHLAPHFSTHETRAELMAELQASGEQADRETLSSFSVLDCTGDEVRSMAPRFFAALHAHMTGVNYHTEALMLACRRAGRDDLAAGLAHLVKYQTAPDYSYLPWSMSEARSAISQALRTGTADPVSPEAQALLESWGLFLWGQTPSDPPPGVGGVAHSILESAPGFSKVKPFSMDPRKLLAAGLAVEKLVGLGVFYLGNNASPSGEGAITEAADTRGQSFGDLNMVCTLEDGRVIKASPHSFTGENRPIFQLTGKMHGAPYLSQLAAVRASLKAQHSSAKAMAEAEHARQLEALAAEFPQLERPGKNQGGKLVAINMRKLLKQAFNAVKFSVTSDYNSARVGWTDGPTVEQVEAVIGRFDIGHSDCQSDYFYTSETAFSKLFGGVQYLTTRRDHTDPLVSRAIAEAFQGREVPQDATPKDWRSASGAFAWNTDGGKMFSRSVREILSKTPA